jgi:colanic acid biosynthesis protein WcaH
LAIQKRLAVDNIPNDLYAKIVELMPIVCVDILIHDKGGKVLLVRRNQEPAKGKWWLVGGRVHKGERLEEAVWRKCEEEVGLKQVRIKSDSLIGIYEHFFDVSAQGVPTHTICLAYSVEVDDLSEVKTDNTIDICAAVDADDILFNGEYDDYVRNIVEGWLEK